MSTYAVLGATGSTGQSLMRVLLQHPDKQIKAFCRSRSKLTTSLPELNSPENKSRVEIFEGTLADTSILAACLSNTRAAFLAVALSTNAPGCSVAQETAHAVMEALQNLRKADPGVQLPRLVVLSSASVSHQLMSHVPRFLHGMLWCAASHIYADLRSAEEYFRENEDFVKTVFVKPAALSRDPVVRGHALSFEKAISPVGWLDLAGGMLEVADCEGEEFDMRDVAVNSARPGEVAFPWDAPLGLAMGLLFWAAPWTYRFLG